MKYILTESNYKSYNSSNHIETIKDILAEYTDNKDFNLSVGISPLLLAGGNAKLINRNRTFHITIWLDQKIVRDLLSPTQQVKFDKYTDGISYGGFTCFPGIKIIINRRISDLKKECISRLDKFGYRLYRDDMHSYDVESRSFTVTYRPNKFKI